ncbi:MAG: multiheme c-type cytochrome, partial [Brevundimonas sp.]|uniref:HEAT repeat domain-containing protein n=1 Tax=Brevundimonas sp. TaxID=1871086 RepID=UPI0027371382
PDDKLDLAGFHPPQTFQHGSQTTEARKTATGYQLISLGFDHQRTAYPVQRVIGHAPLRQFLVQGPRGALHAMEACFDPKRGDWFNVYGDEDRQPGDWGHWTGRGMVWNQMCAACHNTRVRKNYDPETDAYQTRMAEMTVSCESCHGPMKAHDDWQRQAKDPGQKDPTLVQWTRDQHLDTCAGCHARRGEITGDFVPGDSFWDHYLLTLTDSTDIYYPDGQIRDENYEFSSFLSSRMHHAGVRCMDCHDMHSMKPILPGNQLCVRCHTPGGYPNAPVIQPEAHSFHSAASTGNQCINCHMPQTTYMQRHPRHDHGFTIPDPQLTKDHGVPNACNKCHSDQTVDWALAATQKWYGDKMNRRTRSRAYTIAKARQGDPTARDELLTLLDSDEIPPWKASATLLLEPWVSEPTVQSALSRQLQHPHPRVRQSAARVLEP